MFKDFEEFLSVLNVHRVRESLIYSVRVELVEGLLNKNKILQERFDKLNANGGVNQTFLRYLIVGGVAGSFHVQPRATKDIDILVGQDTANSTAVFGALREFGAPIRTIFSAWAARRWVMVGLLPRISGIEFDLAWSGRVTVALNDKLSAPFISRADLLAARLVAGTSRR